MCAARKRHEPGLAGQGQRPQARPALGGQQNLNAGGRTCGIVNDEVNLCRV